MRQYYNSSELLPVCTYVPMGNFGAQKKNRPRATRMAVVGVTGFEPVTSAYRTQALYQAKLHPDKRE